LGLAFHHITSLLLNGCNAGVVNLLCTNSHNGLSPCLIR
jgi:hypothetical protein